MGDWRGIGCKAGSRVKEARGRVAAREAWRLRRPRSMWVIEAAHAPYLGRPPYDFGNDAWRISIQRDEDDEGRPVRVEVAHVIAASESEAFDSVVWLDAVCQGRRQ